MIIILLTKHGNKNQVALTISHILFIYKSYQISMKCKYSFLHLKDMTALLELIQFLDSALMSFNSMFLILIQIIIFNAEMISDYVRK